MGRNGSFKRPAAAAAPPAFTVNPSDYRLMEEVGYGAHAVVFRAVFLPSNATIAVKCLDLDQLNNNIDEVQREAQIMSLIDHPNVIRAYCSFVVEHSLWVIMPFMTEGSCLHLMKIAYPEGFEEPVIASILKETLKALEYLHRQGQIHRDVKAGNILIDSAGIVKLGDFGVSACMFDRGDRQRSRNTFVGTPCWMAPEVLQPGTGYNFKADIWSFGITALELAHGHAPFSKYPPMKVLLMTLQNAPPGLDYDRDRRFSKAFKEMVAMCLVKDQTKRPTAEKLLKHSFFKSAKPPELTMKGILTDLPPLWDRVKALQLKDAAQLALKKMPSSEQEALSLSEYQRGVSAWHFDIEDLKAQASLIYDDEPSEIKENDAPRTIDVEKQDSYSRNPLGQSSSAIENYRSELTCTTISDAMGIVSSSAIENYRSELTCTTISDAMGIVSYPVIKFAMSGSDCRRIPNGYENSRLENDSLPSTSKKDPESKYWRSNVGQKQQSYSGPMESAVNSSTTERSHGFERDATAPALSEKHGSDTRRAANLSGPLSLPTRASANSLSAPIRSSGGYVDSLGDKSKRNVVHIKGRFSVTSENVDLAKVQEIPLSSISRKSPHLRKSASVGDWIVNAKPMSNSHHLKELCNSSVSSSILIPHLENLVQQTTLQQDLIVNLLSSMQQNEKADGAQSGMSSQVQTMESETVVETANTEKERSLLVKISELQSRMITLTDELISAKLKHVQLQQELNALYCREEIEDIRDEDIIET
ncbi:STE20/SPS1-related proline-alanine-rich protein kinase-like isoform X3 [Lolium rigidum]|uniref:STE20/SPS1-related proline-alanine-rich protein kinase-like isoform X3 n=1 Tax=Lolium rigidum TaxID=89674 RepID=UPI001F5DD79A|nr:STE20/SPS1-related proline-alanine-rich protein kinase-like isoform X3 [Lolium rigidum]